jgi:hypothetical protein
MDNNVITAQGAKLFAALYPHGAEPLADGQPRSTRYLLGVCSSIATDAAAYKRRMERECNGDVPPGRAGVRWGNATVRLQNRIRCHVASLGDGFGVTFEGDPRGACVYITTPDKRSDDWGGRGICALQD